MEFAGTVVGGKYRLVSESEQGWVAAPVEPVSFASRGVRIRKVGGVTADNRPAVKAMTEWVSRAVRVQHPSVAAVLDVVPHDGLYWIVSEFSDRSSLLHEIRRTGRMSVDDVVDMGTELTQALLATTAAGIEADPQPVNVLAAPVQQQFQLDLAMSLERHLRLAVPDGSFPSPPVTGYANLDDIVRDTDGADLFGLGVTLFYAVAGRLPSVEALADLDGSGWLEYGDLGRLIGMLLQADPRGRPPLDVIRGYLRTITDDRYRAPRGSDASPPAILTASAPPVPGGPPPAPSGRPPTSPGTPPPSSPSGPWPPLLSGPPPVTSPPPPPSARAPGAPFPVSPPSPSAPGGPPPSAPAPGARLPVSPPPPAEPNGAGPVPLPPMVGAPQAAASAQPGYTRRRGTSRREVPRSSPAPRAAAPSASRDVGEDRTRRAPSRVERAVSRTLRQGLLSFAAPDSMRQGRKERIEVGIAREVSGQAELDRGFRTSGPRVTEQVQTADYMTVELVGDAFTILPLSAPTQVIAPTAHWEFDVTPLRSGDRTLTLKGTSLVRIDGDERSVAVPSFDRTIKVDVDVMYGVRQFTGTNWQWILGTVVALGGAIAGWISLF